jgi:hypothetical protein
LCQYLNFTKISISQDSLFYRKYCVLFNE